jgi:hypothetical protein
MDIVMLLEAGNAMTAAKVTLLSKLADKNL